MAERRADWLSVAEARSAILDGMFPLDPEHRSLEESLGHVLAAPVTSPVDLPPWDNSAMDGFAVRADDVRGASGTAPVELRVIEDVPAGAFPELAIRPGTAIRVMTGAPVPRGADSVIRVEHTEGFTAGSGAGSRVRILKDDDAGRNVRMRGEDLRADTTVLTAGAPVTAAAVGVAASVGRSRP